MTLLESASIISSFDTILPYQATEKHWERGGDGDSLWSGTDTTLDRRVWIHCRRAGSSPVPARRRDLARPGRLRWLACGNLPDGVWDAYEAVDGFAIEGGTLAAMPWSSVCRVMIDAAREFETSGNDEGLPSTLRTYRVWLTREGRVLLLDFPGPVTALWPSPDGAIVIARHAQTGRYAAYSVTANCSR